MKFRKGSRLTRRRDYLAVQERGRRVCSGALWVLVLKNQVGKARLGVTVSSRVGNAVIRNRIKRWVREAFRQVSGTLPDVDVVVIARAGAEKAGLAGAIQALERAGAPARPPRG